MNSKKKLKLGKKSVIELDLTKTASVKGGVLGIDNGLEVRTNGCGGGFSSGCSDSTLCGPLRTNGLVTNCTNGYCTDDCPTNTQLC